MERDEESGLSYQGARYYAPWLGQWTSCEPSPLIDGTNLFAFVKQNPVLFVDPSGHGPDEQKLGKKNEKVIKKQQDAANKRRAQENRTPVEVKRQQGVGGKREVIPDEVKWLKGGTSDRRVIEAKGRHVGSESNRTPASRKADIIANLEQAKDQLKALQAAGEVGETARANVLRVIWDSDKGKSSAAARPEWTQEAEDARDKWVGEAQDPSERALRERVKVTTTTHDRLLKATRESKVRARGQGLDGTPGKGFVGTALDILSLIDIASDVSSGEYKSAATKSGILVVSATIPGASEVLFGLAILETSRDPQLLQISEAIGEHAEDYTGSHLFGGLATAGAHVMLSTGVAAGKMIMGMLPSSAQWAITHHSAGSLIPAGIVTPFLVGPGLRGLHRYPGQP